MDRKFIKALMANGTKMCEVPQDKAMTHITREVLRVYTLNGLQRNMSPEAFAQEIKACALALYDDFVHDSKYRNIRDTEISYIFSNGMKGRLGTDKDIVLTYKSLVRWMEGYVNHRERLGAVNDIITDSFIEPARQIPRYVVTEEDTRNNIEQALKDYIEYKRVKPKSGRGGDPRRLFDTAAPYLIKDYSGAFIAYMIKHGYARDGEKFIDVLDRALANGGKYVKLNQQPNK